MSVLVGMILSEVSVLGKVDETRLGALTIFADMLPHLRQRFANRRIGVEQMMVLPGVPLLEAR